jgi:aryl-alcohol dehydrogenase-like predicted oxidoreductase
MGDFRQPRILGRTGLSVARLGLGASYGAPSASYLEAFERGVRYFYWGSLRKDPMADAIRTIARSHRSELVVVVQSYARAGFLVKLSFERALRRLGLEYADVLLLGWYNGAPPAGIVDAAAELRARGKVRHVALSGHNRKLFPTLLDHPEIDIWHLRYNAVHRGAEREVFPELAGRDARTRPGIVSYTTTRWGHLCDPRRVPAGDRVPDGTDCLRFALSRPEIDVAISGPDSSEHMRQALRALELGPMNEEELAWMRRVGDAIYRRDTTSGARDRV